MSSAQIERYEQMLKELETIRFITTHDRRKYIQKHAENSPHTFLLRNSSETLSGVNNSNTMMIDDLIAQNPPTPSVSESPEPHKDVWRPTKCFVMKLPNITTATTIENRHHHPPSSPFRCGRPAHTPAAPMPFLSARRAFPTSTLESVAGVDPEHGGVCPPIYPTPPPTDIGRVNLFPAALVAHLKTLRPPTRSMDELRELFTARSVIPPAPPSTKLGKRKKRKVRMTKSTSDKLSEVEASIRVLLSDEYELKSKSLPWASLTRDIYSITRLSQWAEPALPKHWGIQFHPEHQKACPTDFKVLYVLQSHFRYTLGDEVAKSIAPHCVSLVEISRRWHTYYFVCTRLVDVMYFHVNATALSHRGHDDGTGSNAKCQCSGVKGFFHRGRVSEIAAEVWAQVVLRSHAREVVTNEVLTFVNATRNGNLVDEAVEETVKDIFHMAQQTGFYNELRDVVLRDAMQYYSTAVVSLIETADREHSYELFVNHVSAWRDLQIRATRWSTSDVAGRLEALVLNLCMAIKWDTTVRGYVQTALRSKDDVFCTRLLQLCHGCRDLDRSKLCSSLTEFIETDLKISLELIPLDAPEIHNVVVEIISREHAWYNSTIVVNGTNNSGDAFDAVRKAFVSIVNVTGAMFKVESSESLVARALHHSLRSCTSMDITTANLDLILDLVPYLKAKDIFCLMFRSSLARRVIEKTFDEDLERYSISSLMRVASIDFAEINRAQSFLNDAVANGQICVSLCESQGLKDFTVQLMSHALWPLSSDTLQLQLPPRMASDIQLFTSQYVHANANKRLSWLWPHSYVFLVREGQPTVSYEAEILQSCILLALSAAPDMQLSHAELHEKIAVAGGMDLQSKFKQSLDVLKRSGIVVVVDVVVSLNPEYKPPPKLRRVSLRPVRRGVLAAPTVQEVNDRRTFVLRAAIVRILKSVRVCSHQELVVQILTQVQAKFKPELPLIKRAIERLIEEDYMERLEENSAMYKYKA